MEQQFWYDKKRHSVIYHMRSSDYAYNLDGRKQFIVKFDNADGYNDYCVFYVVSERASETQVRTREIYLTPYFELNKYTGNRLLNETRKEFEFVKSSSSLKHYLASVKQLVKNIDNDILKFQEYIINDMGI